EGAAREASTSGAAEMEWDVFYLGHPSHKVKGYVAYVAGTRYQAMPVIGDDGRVEGYEASIVGHADRGGKTQFLGTFKTADEATDALEKHVIRYKQSLNETPSSGVAEERSAAPAPSAAEDCEHGCPTGECKPFSRLKRDEASFTACMKRAKEIGDLKNPHNVYRLIPDDLVNLDQEHLQVVCIDFRGQLRDWFDIAVGQRHRVAAEVEDILKGVILSGCDLFVIAHPHPSGHAQPSKADGRLTKTVRNAAAVPCPNVLFADHLVCAPGEFYSFTEKKLHKVKRS